MLQSMWVEDAPTGRCENTFPSRVAVPSMIPPPLCPSELCVDDHGVIGLVAGDELRR